MNPYYQRAEFLLSAARLSQLPPYEDAREVAFAGRSNSGKSSALNAICNRRALARTSKTPGRTQLINVFALDDQRRLVDLPGYGFAKVALPIKAQWQGVLTDYIEKRECLAGIVLMMDIRHPMKDLDMQMLDWCQALELPVHILLTKADKLKRGPASKVLFKVRRALAEYDAVTVQLFSALKRQGIDACHDQLDAWLDLEHPDTGGPESA